MRDKDEILEFIHRRFKQDCEWTSGNCYYFALILKTRFRKGKIVYDVIDGHFLYLQGEKLYDHRGVQDLTDRSIIIEWDKFGEYDKNQKRRIIRDCIM